MNNQSNVVNKPLTHSEIVANSAKKLPNSQYLTADISDEAWREVQYLTGPIYKIEKPVTLIIRRGGSTHRVVDENGIVHCYPAPETGLTVLRWKVKESAESHVNL